MITSNEAAQLQQTFEQTHYQVFASNNAVQDKTSQAWSNAMLGIADYQDPNTGQIFTLTSGLSWWKNNQGYLWSTYTSTNPNPSELTPLTPTNQ